MARSRLSQWFPGDGGSLRFFWQRGYYDFNVWSAKKVVEKLEYTNESHL